VRLARQLLLGATLIDGIGAAPVPDTAVLINAGRSTAAGPRPAVSWPANTDIVELVAHCHRGLGTLYATVGQWEQAHAALTTAIEMYRAMDMRFSLPQTETALAQVEG